MLKISCSEMKDIDTYAIKEIGIPSIILMENAALKVIENIDLDALHSFTIVCAPGNNGGDGLAIARHLFLRNKNVDIFTVGNIDKATIDFQINLNILKNMKIKCTHLTATVDLDKLTDALNKNDLTIDAMFGIGLDRPVSGFFYEVIERINETSKNTLAVDIPSGLNGDTGEVLGISIQAQQTICFHLLKKGLVNQNQYTGEIIVADIGIPKSVTETILTP